MSILMMAMATMIALALSSAAYAKAAPTLREGSKSSVVKTVQKQLVKLGYLDKKTKITGYYGELTVTAVAYFQMQNGLNVTGTLDSEQQSYLLSGKPRSATDAPVASFAPASLMLPMPMPDGQIAAVAPSTAALQQASLSLEGMQKIEAMIAYGMQYLGTPYKKGGRGPDSFDCSGFVRYVLLSVGVKAPGSAQTQGDYDAWLKIENRDALRRGDLVFFHTTGRSVAIGHSGIYLGNNEFLHSEPTGGGVIISKVFGVESDGNPSYYNKNFLFARRLFS